MSKVWILGPCSMESRDFYLETARELHKIMDGKDWYYKASFDKANRTSLYGGRGPGLDEAVEAFREVKAEFPNIKLLTDVHETHQVEKLADTIDCIQIPAFLCRQTDLIVECAEHFDKINVKKGQWLGPDNVLKSLDKIKHTNEDCEAWLCERGSNFGYDKLIVDFTIVDQIKEKYDKYIFDCTHSTQRSREVYVYQGDRVLAERYTLASGIFNYDGVFVETHPRPEEAVSDADCQLYLSRIKNLVAMTEKIDDLVKDYK
jgi:2-dehydro-3-deoxyphosphooctonate aldolase (KDO 8-P synthase)